MNEIQAKAIEKIEKEADGFKGDRKAEMIAPFVAATLKKMTQNDSIASAILNSEKTLSDCCAEILKGSGNYISDMDVYGKAAQFYFKGAKVDIVMRIEANGIETTQEGVKKEELPQIKSKATEKHTVFKAENAIKEEQAKEVENPPLEATKAPKPKKEKEKAKIIQLSLFD